MSVTSLGILQNLPCKLRAERFPPIAKQETSEDERRPIYLPRRGQVFQEELDEYRES